MGFSFVLQTQGQDQHCSGPDQAPAHYGGPDQADDQIRCGFGDQFFHGPAPFDLLTVDKQSDGDVNPIMPGVLFDALVQVAQLTIRPPDSSATAITHAAKFTVCATQLALTKRAVLRDHQYYLCSVHVVSQRNFCHRSFLSVVGGSTPSTPGWCVQG
jgi:hypothetical protein